MQTWKWKKIIYVKGFSTFSFEKPKSICNNRDPNYLNPEGFLSPNKIEKTEYVSGAENVVPESSSTLNQVRGSLEMFYTFPEPKPIKILQS